MEKEDIGKKVWVINNNGVIVNKENPAIIVGIKPMQACDDWCDHYVVKADGKLFEEREYDCVFIPDETCDDINSRIDRYLKDNRLFPEEVYVDGETCIIDIDGDWKHDHGWCNVLMGYLGYTLGDEIVTEDTGSDWYGSRHYFYKNAE